MPHATDARTPTQILDDLLAWVTVVTRELEGRRAEAALAEAQLAKLVADIEELRSETNRGELMLKKLEKYGVVAKRMNDLKKAKELA